MDIFVVNLERDQNRRDSIRRQLKALGLAFHLYPAVSGSAITRDGMAKDYSHDKAFRRLCRPMAPEEIGCALSHIGVYRKILSEGLPVALILEDDVALPNSLGVVLDELQRTFPATQPAVVLLSPATGYIRGGKPLPLGYKLLRYRAGYHTSSYVVTNAAAAALLAELYPIEDLADCWRRMQKYKVVNLYVVQPTLIEQKRDDFGSSTTKGVLRVFEQQSMSKVAYKLCRARSKCMEAYYSARRAFARFQRSLLQFR